MSAGGESGPTTPTSSQRRPLSRHLSTPQLETFRVTRSASSVAPVNNYIQPPPMTSFSTFAHNKSRSELATRVQDDPNPYSVSKIDEFRIQIQDPYRIRTKSTIQLSSPSESQRSSSVHYYQELEDYDDDTVHEVTYVHPDEDHLAEKLGSLPKFYKRSSSGGYEIPDTEGSSGGSSEDLPLPSSDTSEEYSHSLSISASSHSDGMSPIPGNFHDVDTLTPSPTKISERDRARIELSLRGRKTEIYVSDSLANLYYKGKNPPRPNSSGSTTPSISSSSTQVQNESSIEWILKYTGVPVLLLDLGDTKSRDRRKIQIVLAELGSGLALWKDTIDNLSSYSVVGGDGTEVSTFHTMHLSSDHTKVVGLSFDNGGSANRFWKEVEKLTSDFANISLSGSKHKNKKENKVKDKRKGGDKWVRPSKSDISTPCAFQHVSSLSSKDRSLFSSLQHFVTGKAAMPTGISPTLPH